MLWNGKLALHNLLVEVLIVLSSEREAATEESEEKYSTGPYVCWRPTKLFFCHDFRSHIRGSTTKDLNLLIVGDAS